MKKGPRTRVGEMRSEYDFRSLKDGVRGKYVDRSRSGTNLVLLEPDLARAFPTSEAVNEALRAVLGMASMVSGSKKKRKPRS